MNQIESFTDDHGNAWVRHSDGTYHAPECYDGCPDGITLDETFVSWLGGFGSFTDVVYAD